MTDVTSRKDQLKQFLSNATALLDAMRYSTATASGDAANIGRYSSYKMFLRKYNDLVKQTAPFLPNTTMLDLFALDKIKGSGDTTWPQQKECFDLAYSNTVLLRSLLEGVLGYAEDETHNLRDFIQANLRLFLAKIDRR